MAHPPPAAVAAPAPPAYGLPPLPPLPCPDFRGPTPWSNWAIKGRLLAGAYPASLDDGETDRILTTLLELGVDTFVCLQAEFSLHTPEAAWRAGQGLRPYIKDAQQILIRSRESYSHRIKQDKLDFLHLPIIDGNVTSDVALSRLADDCCVRILRGERMYIHCWGGHGRTGTLVAVMLGRLYGVTCAAALRFTQAFHDSRKFPQGVRSPQTTPQVQQVKRLLPDPPSLRGVTYPCDPAMVLDDTIVRPSSALPSPKVPAAAAAAAGGAAASVPATCGTAAAVDMEVDEPQLLPSKPVNQQRKDAIRAKQTGSGGAGGSAPAPARTTAAAAAAGGLQAGLASVAAAGITAAMQAASLAPKEADATAAVAAPAASRIDWLQGMFEKGQSKLATLRATGSGIGATHGKLAAAGLAGTAQGPQRNSYLQQYVQQQEQLAGGLPVPAKQDESKAGARSSKVVINLSASSSSTTSGVPYDEDVLQAIDMRPQKVTVVVPDSSAERSASSMARMLNYFSGRATPTR